MECQFTFVKRFAEHDHLIIEPARLNGDHPDIFRTWLPASPHGQQPVPSTESFLTLYCLQDET